MNETNNFANQEIDWTLLPEDDFNFIRSIGIEMLPDDIEFHRPISWLEFCRLFFSLYQFHELNLEEENNVEWVIGHCVAYAHELFGEKKVHGWLDDFLYRYGWRKAVVVFAGNLLIILQNIEKKIRLFCEAIELRGVKIKYGDMFSADEKILKLTLGQLSSVIKQNDVFGVGFEEKLSRFVGNRNRFVHRIWVEFDENVSDDIEFLPNVEMLTHAGGFLKNLFEEAVEINKVFDDSLIYIKVFSDKDFGVKIDRESLWTQHLPNLMNALDGKPLPKIHRRHKGIK